MELVRESLIVVDALREVLAASAALLKKKPVEVIIEVDEALPPVYADKLRFNQILLNLVSNAAKFTGEGSITLRAEIYESETDKILISVTDTGIGIAADKIDAIFDRFRQADSSTTRQYGGSGLGLPICKQLIEMHGGEIWITSEEGVGSTFWFTIPIDNPDSDELGETAGVTS
jgi:signal transduction histidine kinase